MAMGVCQTLDRQPTVALLTLATLCIAFSVKGVSYAQGEVSQLTPVFPSWDRVIEELRQATLQQKQALAAIPLEEQQLAAQSARKHTASTYAASTEADKSDLQASDLEDADSQSASAMGVDDDEDFAEDELVDDGTVSAHSTYDGTATASMLNDADIIDEADVYDLDLEDDTASAASGQGQPVKHSQPKAQAEAPQQKQKQEQKQALHQKSSVMLQATSPVSAAGSAELSDEAADEPADVDESDSSSQVQTMQLPFSQPGKAPQQRVSKAAAPSKSPADSAAGSDEAVGADVEAEDKAEGMVQAPPQQQQEVADADMASDIRAADNAEPSEAAAGSEPEVVVVEASVPQAQPPTAQQPQQQQQQQPAKLPKGAFPAAYLARPSATISTAAASPMRASLQGLSVISDTDSFRALPQLPVLRGIVGNAAGQAALQDGSSSSSSSGPASGAQGSKAKEGPRVRLLQPSNLLKLNSPAPQQQQQQQGSDAAVSAPTADETTKADESDRKLEGHKIMPREPLHISPPPSLTSLTAIDIDHALLQIPSSFMGISHEWNHVEDLNAAPGYKAALRLLGSYGTGPFIVRVGGGSTDSTKEVLSPNVYKALRQMYKEAGVRYILGLNFEDADMKLTQAQVKRAKANMPEGSLVTFELGNEPNFYGRKKNMTALEYSRCCFTTEWTEFARNLSCPCGTDQCCEDSQFAGPAWGHINVYPSTIKWFLDNAASYVSVVTVHWYKATKETSTTPASLLDEGPVRVEMDNLRQLVQVANSFGKPLRVAEMNTISNSGRLGVSNVFAAALWTLDGAFEVAAAGAVGVNLHQGAGQNLYTAILRRVEGSKLKPVVLRPPFYGMLLFQQAVRGGAILLGKQQLSADLGHIKVWPLMDTANGELRFVLINKHPKQAATQVLRLPADSSSSYQSIARLSRLVAQGEDPLAATSGITLGGRYYSAGCVQQGRDQTLLLEADAGPTKQLAWSIYLPPGSATLATVLTAAQAV